MDTTISNGNLYEQKGKLKQKFAKLTENDPLFREGKNDEKFGKHRNSLAKTREELHRIISRHKL